METTNQKEEVRQYLTFKLADDLYGFNVLKVREVLDLPKVTRVPRAAGFLIGVINLRGSVVPVVDLRRKFGTQERPYTVDTSIIIVEAVYDNELLHIGALVDSVREVIRLTAADLEAPPRYGMKLSHDLIEAMGKRGGDFVIILHADKVFSEEELSFAAGDVQTESTEVPAANS